MPDYALLNQCVYEGKAGDVERMTRETLAEGRSAQEIPQDGLIAGMSVVGEDFKHNILYVPEVLIAARRSARRLRTKSAPAATARMPRRRWTCSSIWWARAPRRWLRPNAARLRPRPANATARYQVLYWQDLPSQVKTWDEFEEIKVDLAPRFAVRIDAAAQRLGLTKSDDYLAQWRWGDEAERAGSAPEVARLVREEIEAAAP